MALVCLDSNDRGDSGTLGVTYLILPLPDHVICPCLAESYVTLNPFVSLVLPFIINPPCGPRSHSSLQH